MDIWRMRYGAIFFDFLDGESIRDEKGIELASIGEVNRAAGEKMATFLTGDKRRAWTGDDWPINVRHENRTLALVLSLTATTTGAMG